METSDLDLPLLPSAEQIRRREFATVRRGYDPDQVRDYLIQVAAQVDTLEKELRGDGDGTVIRPTGIDALAEIAEVDAEATVTATTDDPYQRIAKRFAVVFETADTEAEDVVARARTEAEQRLLRPRSEADRIRVDAQARAEQARQEGQEALERAQREAGHVLGDLDARRESLVTQLDSMRDKLLSVADDLTLPPTEDGLVTASISTSLPPPEEDAEDEPWLASGVEIPELELSDLEPEERDRS